MAGLVVLSVGRGSVEQAAVNRALKAAGAVVLVRFSAGEMSQLLRAFVPSVIVTEVAPAADDTAAVLPALRRLAPDQGGNVPVVGIRPRAGDDSAAAREGFQAVLSAPFDVDDVARTVLAVIERAG